MDNLECDNVVLENCRYSLVKWSLELFSKLHLYEPFTKLTNLKESNHEVHN